MFDTPFFPAWQTRLGPPPKARAAQALQDLRDCTLAKLEERFGALFAGEAQLQRGTGHEVPYSVRRTWWCFLWQMLQGYASCREVVHQLQALAALQGRRSVSEKTGAYCLARARLPVALLERAVALSARAADESVAVPTQLKGRVVKVLDGTALRLPDTPANQALYPQPSTQKPGCGFPQMNVLVVWSARGGGVLDLATGDLHQGEMRLLHRLLPGLSENDILIYDRAAGHYGACALVRSHKMDLISRVAIRQIDWRKGQRLGPNERLVTWKKSAKRSPFMTAQEWAALPAEIIVRVIRVRVRQPGYRPRELVLVTTLLDAQAYPAHEIATAYLRRWRLEMCLDDIKTVMGLAAPRCLSPAMVQREVLQMLVAHNLVRTVMAQAAREHDVPLDRISFTGTLDTLRSFCIAQAGAAPAARKRLAAELLRIIAADLVPHRPGRSEPRAVKGRPKPFPWMTCPRHSYRDGRHNDSLRRRKPLSQKTLSPT